MDFPHLSHLLIPIAREAGAAIMNVYGRAEAQFKADGSPVTEADEAAEALILPALKAASPEITIISEENAASHALKAPDTFWLVDPLDGTKEFLKRDGKGAFTVNIALIQGGVPVFGIVYAPALNRLFVGYAGSEGKAGAAWTQDGNGNGNGNGNGGVDGARDLRVRAVPATGAVAVASASHRDEATDSWLAARGIGQTKSIGSSLKFCLVAAGEADVYPRFGPTMEWDTAAGDAVLRAAGGMVETLDGSPYPYAKPDYRNGPFIARGQA